FISMFGRLDWDATTLARGYLDAMDVELLVTPPLDAAPFAGRGLLPLMSEKDAVYYANPGHMGHAWVNYAVRRVYAEAEAIDYFLGQRFDPHREVIVEQATRRHYARPGPDVLAATAPIREDR